MGLGAAAYWLQPNQQAAVDRLLDKLGGKFTFTGEDWVGRCPDCHGPKFHVRTAADFIELVCLNQPNYCGVIAIRQKANLDLGDQTLPAPIHQFSKNGTNGTNGRHPAKPPLTVRWLKDVQPEPIYWLWQGWIARSALCCIGGDPGIGKSYLLSTIAAAYTRGLALPGGEPTDPGIVLVFSDEDHMASVTVPRLLKLGADMSRIAEFSREDGYQLDDEGIDQLEQLIVETGAGLVTIDPIMATMGEHTDTKSDASVRQKLRRLRAIAEKYAVTIIYLLHLNKGTQQDLIYRFMGSMAFASTPRSTLVVGTDKEHQRRAIFMAKSNLGRWPEPVGFEITDDGLLWLPSTDLTKDDILNHQQANPEQAEERQERQTLITKCVKAIEEMLRPGAVPGSQLNKELLDAGFSRATIDRARTRANVESRRVSIGSKTYYECYLAPNPSPAPASNEEHIDFEPVEAENTPVA